MNEILRKELWRKLEALPDEKAYQVLDYIKFLDSKYGPTNDTATGFQRFGEAVQDTLRQRRVPASALRETMKVLGTADRVLGAFKEAGREFLAELEVGSSEPAVPEEENPPTSAKEIEVD